MKITIKNRKNQKIVAIVEGESNKKGLVFIMHGWGGYKEQPQFKTITQVFLKNKYIVVRFDTTNTLGESEGHTKYSTPTGYYQDLEDVIYWAELQNWYQEPFCLVGHSLGSFCIGLYTARHPEKIKGLAPLSITLSGKLHQNFFTKKEMIEWKKRGWRPEKSTSKPGQVKTMSWEFMEDFLKYDLLEKADKLTMPVLMAVGENDKGTPYKSQKLFYDKLPGPKELHLIKNSGHTFRDKGPLQELQEIFDKWIKQELT